MAKVIALEDCKRCRRLHNHLKKTQLKYPEYFCKPVPAFGDDKAQLIIVGLAPGLHGANASGIPFTGDASGEFLFKTLHSFGYANHADSNIGADLKLINCKITNAVKCLPPQNKPTNKEVQNCTKYFLQDELTSIAHGSIILAIGTLAHNAVLRTFGKTLSSAKFEHNKLHQLTESLVLIDSYHCSRYNTQTKRLTQKMFDEVFIKIESLLIQSND